MSHDDAKCPPGDIIVASVSGGKDSAALSLWLKEQGYEHRRVFADTGWEHRSTYDYLDGELTRALGPIDRVRSTIGGMADLIRKKGMFPQRLRRYCTQELKTRPLAKYIARMQDEHGEVVNAVGIRAEESASRALDVPVEYMKDYDKRDARRYPGPHPVVAHPPCSRWCMLAGLVEKRWGHKRGEDGGCFASALGAVRKWGGVLEHPAYSLAWATYGLPKPNRHGGWTATLCGGWVCHVQQGRYGHPAKKATWLYAHGVKLMQLKWGSQLDAESTALVSWCGNHVRSGERRMRVGKRAAAATPKEFRDVLLAMARSARVKEWP